AQLPQEPAPDLAIAVVGEEHEPVGRVVAEEVLEAVAVDEPPVVVAVLVDDERAVVEDVAAAGGEPVPGDERLVLGRAAPRRHLRGRAVHGERRAESGADPLAELAAAAQHAPAARQRADQVADLLAHAAAIVATRAAGAVNVVRRWSATSSRARTRRATSGRTSRASPAPSGSRSGSAARSSSTGAG